MLIVGLLAAGSVGAMSRSLADGWLQRRTPSSLPWATFMINVTGSLILGLVVGLAQYHGLGRVPVTVIGIGFCGAFTTFSAFSYETVRLLERGALFPAATNTIGSVVVGLLAAAAGIALVGAL